MTFASCYSKKALNIREVRHLAQRLGYPESLLVDLALKSTENYKPEKKEPKKSGGFRITNEPKTLLKAVQKKINRLLQEVKLPPNFFGSVKHKSHIQNAKEHINQNFVACFDIRDYFPSIHYERIKSVFVRLGCSPEVSVLLANLTSYEHHLPQGAPTSSTIANLVFAEKEKRFSALAKQHGLKVTFYQDDITFSGKRDISKLKNLIRKMIFQIGFETQEKKVKITHRTQKQEVMGLEVNNVLKVPQKHIQALMDDILKYELGEISKKMNRDSFLGRILYVKSVDSEKSSELLSRFEEADQKRARIKNVPILQQSTV